jgi:hypothetical protein
MPTPPPPTLPEPDPALPKPSESTAFVPPQPPVASSSSSVTDLDWHNFLIALQLRADLPEDEADADYNFEQDQQQDPFLDEEIPRSAIPRREIFDIQNDRTAGTPNSAISDYSEYSSEQVLSPEPPTPGGYPYTKRQKVTTYAGRQDQNPILPVGQDAAAPTSLDTAESATAVAAAIAAVAPMTTFRRTDLVSVDPWDVLIDQLQQIQRPQPLSTVGFSGRPDAILEAQTLQEQLERLRKQMQQHFQLLIQVNLLCRATPSGVKTASQSWQLMGELAGFYNKGKESEEARNRAVMADQPVPAVFPSNVLFDIKGFHLLQRFQEIVPAELDPNRMSTSVFVEIAHVFKDYFQDELGIVHQEVAGGYATYRVTPLHVQQMADKASASSSSNQDGAKSTRDRIKWTPAEDLLLVLGLHRYQYSWDSIHANYLPTKDIKQIKNRFKNRKKTATPNPVKLFWHREMMPATEQEKASLIQAMSTHGKDFDGIARDFFSHRSPNFLRKLWDNELEPMLRAIEMQKKFTLMHDEHQQLHQQQKATAASAAIPARPAAAAAQLNDTVSQSDDDMDVDTPVMSTMTNVSTSTPSSVVPASLPPIPRVGISRLPPGEDSMAISGLFSGRDLPQPPATTGTLSAAITNSVSASSIDATGAPQGGIPPPSPVPTIGDESVPKRRKIDLDASTAPVTSTQPPTPRIDDSAAPSPTTPISASLVKQALLSDPNLLQSVLRDSGFVLLPPSAAALTPQDQPTVVLPTVASPLKHPTAPAQSPVPPPSPAPLPQGLSNVVDMPDGSRAVFSREEDKEVLVALKQFRGNIPEASFLEIAQNLKFSKTPTQIEMRSKQLLLALTRPT